MIFNSVGTGDRESKANRSPSGNADIEGDTPHSALLGCLVVSRLRLGKSLAADNRLGWILWKVRI
jgi:hypothetical protein